MAATTSKGSRIFEILLGTLAAASTTGVHAAVTDNGAPQVVTTGITNPAVPRNITATAGGTAADIKAIAVVIVGTDATGAALTETLPVFVVDTAGTKVGAKAFKTVTSITIPAHDGTGATTAIGWGSVIGIGELLARDNILRAWLDDVKESTAATVAVSATVLASNTVTFNTALAGQVGRLAFYRSPT